MISKALTVVLLGGLLATSPPVASGPESLVAWQQWGLAGIVVAFALYTSREREHRQAKAEMACHTYIRETMHGAIERNTKAFERFAERSSTNHGD